MQRLLRTLLCVALTVGLLAGPTLLAAPSPTWCSTNGDIVAEGAGCTSGSCDTRCSSGCCTTSAEAEKSCCRKPADSPAQPAVSKGTCGTCPPGQCPCCDARHSLVIAVVLTGDDDAFQPPPVAPVVAPAVLFDSRSDEPLLPPPIA